MYGPLLKLVNDQAGRDYIEADFLQDPFHGPQVFQIPLASKRWVLGGDNIFRDGADIVATKRENAGLQIQTGFQECDFEKLMVLKAKMERLCEQARLRSERGWGPKVELQWRPEGKYYARYADILDGDLDMPMNWLKMETPQHTVRPEDCILSLIRKPYWREDEETLENFVENPSFLLTVGGYPGEPAFGFDAWDISGGATAGVDVINWIQGGQSIYVVCPNFALADSGIETEHIVLVANTWYYVEAWIWHRSGNRVTMRIERQTGPAWLIPVALWTPGFNIMPVMDEQAGIVDSGWREPGFIRKGFVFQAPASGDYRINIGVTVADDVGGQTHFDVDRVYLTEAVNLNWIAQADRVLDPTDDWKETYLMPRAWCSGREITTHTDLGDCDHGDGFENHIRWWDVEDVPGNLPALTEIKDLFLPTVSEDYYQEFWMAQRSREVAYEYMDELNIADNFALYPDTSEVAEVLTPECSYASCNFATSALMISRVTWELTQAEALNLRGAFRPLGLFLQPSGAQGDIQVQFRALSVAGAYLTQDGPERTIVPGGNFSTWRLIEMGLFYMPWFEMDDSVEFAFPSTLRLIWRAARTAGASSVYCAGFFLMPVDESYLSWWNWDPPVVDGSYLLSSTIAERPALFHLAAATPDRLEPGQSPIGHPAYFESETLNRFFFQAARRADGDLMGNWHIRRQPFHISARYKPRFL